MKLPIRYFSIGILTASLMIALSLYFFDHSSGDLKNESVETIIAFLEDDGYRVITEDEYISLSVGGENDQDEDKDDEEEEDPLDTGEDEDEDEDKDEEGSDDKENTSDQDDESSDNDSDQDEDEVDEEPEEETVVTYTLHVEPGMLAPNVSQILLDNDIIDDANGFQRYLEEKDYSKYIQLGDHKLSSDMSFYELAEEITSY